MQRTMMQRMLRSALCIANPVLSSLGCANGARAPCRLRLRCCFRTTRLSRRPDGSPGLLEVTKRIEAARSGSLNAEPVRDVQPDRLRRADCPPRDGRCRRRLLLSTLSVCFLLTVSRSGLDCARLIWIKESGPLLVHHLLTRLCLTRGRAP